MASKKRIYVTNLVAGKSMRNVTFTGVNPIRPRNIFIEAVLIPSESVAYCEEENRLIVLRTYTKRNGWTFLCITYIELAIWNGWKYTDEKGRIKQTKTD